ncbi:hypothetical protein GCM10022243_11400 [Saccharothrix violaceirubra]|uniref:Helix-turn-helix domain-containing protein n=1 Tax=Saccharothrix violaceirubra TaxID=413306 RepID=A0A7W7WZ48_9PSEU|nr:hypothetical protein [Saccharothrix violaceirubra]
MELSRSNSLTIRQAAWLLGCGEAGVWRAVRTGLLPTVAGRGGVIRVPACAVARLVESPERGVRR